MLVDWYRTLIALRRSHPELCRGAHVPLPSADDVVAYRVGDLVMAANAGYGESTLDMTGGAASDGEWAVVADSTDALAGRATPPDAGAETGHGARGTATVTLPARSFTVWQRCVDDAQ